MGAGHPAFFSPCSPLALATLASGDSFVRLFAAERPEGISCLCPRPLTPVPCGPLPSSVSLFCQSRCVHNLTHVDHIKEKEARKQNGGDAEGWNARCCCWGPRPTAPPVLKPQSPSCIRRRKVENRCRSHACNPSFTAAPVTSARRWKRCVSAVTQRFSR